MICRVAVSWISHVCFLLLFFLPGSVMFAVVCVNDLMMYYDWRECVLSELGTT